MERKTLNDNHQRLVRSALRAAEMDRMAPGLDEYWILHVVEDQALRGALRRQLYYDWLQDCATRGN